MEQKEKTYNGWTNYETWIVSLWLGNDRVTYDYWIDACQSVVQDAEASRFFTKREVAVMVLADRLKEEILQDNPVQDASMYADLIGSALTEVNWHEIAKSMMDDHIDNE